MTSTDDIRQSYHTKLLFVDPDDTSGSETREVLATFLQHPVASISIASAGSAEKTVLSLSNNASYHLIGGDMPRLLVHDGKSNVWMFHTTPDTNVEELLGVLSGMVNQCSSTSFGHAQFSAAVRFQGRCHSTRAELIGQALYLFKLSSDYTDDPWMVLPISKDSAISLDGRTITLATAEIDLEFASEEWAAYAYMMMQECHISYPCSAVSSLVRTMSNIIAEATVFFHGIVVKNLDLIQTPVTVIPFEDSTRLGIRDTNRGVILTIASAGSSFNFIALSVQEAVKLTNAAHEVVSSRFGQAIQPVTESEPTVKTLSWNEENDSIQISLVRYTMEKNPLFATNGSIAMSLATSKVKQSLHAKPFEHLRVGPLKEKLEVLCEIKKPKQIILWRSKDIAAMADDFLLPQLIRPIRVPKSDKQIVVFDVYERDQPAVAAKSVSDVAHYSWQDVLDEISAGRR
ncbi:hypothetical protein J8273_6811 [Carpediemonas membranifera]|uniref:Uncharacterized protein n=1 Tax=Carpediemonas membranifera TaxID=201153 RepID=A0A8J6AUI7_9EUKA|nr:hypothetical protein J8273_6811 [Carpediemonas membranifera]|eukprot:KAG9391920.1 hypothetical protein J8273_6811 [Carpediemonas membranifera]